MGMKRPPDIEWSKRGVYEKISKADLIEAFRDLARETCGFGEDDNDLWFDELQRRVEICRRQRQATNEHHES